MNGSENIQFLSNNANQSTATSLKNHALNFQVSQKPLLIKSQESHKKSSLNQEEINRILRKSTDNQKQNKTALAKKRISFQNKTMDGIVQSNKGISHKR
jgi:hypothetical protein